MLIVQFSIFHDIFIYTCSNTRDRMCLCKQLNMEIFFLRHSTKDVWSRRNKEICKWRRSQSTVSQRFKRRCGLTSIALVLAFTYSRYNSSYFFPSLIELCIVKNFRLRAHLSNRAKRVSSSIALWIFHRGRSCGAARGNSCQIIRLQPFQTRLHRGITTRENISTFSAVPLG